eukprot:PITA_26861
MVDEMTSLHKNESWDLVELLAGRKCIGSKWMIKKKTNAKGKVEKYKDWLVAKERMDVKTTFLHKDLEEEIYMNKPEGFAVKGMKIERDRENKKLWLNQRKYVETILQRFNMQDTKPVKVPIPVGVKLSAEQCPKTQEEEEDMSRVPYASVVGTLMHAMVYTRPEIAHVVGVLSRFM